MPWWPIGRGLALGYSLTVVLMLKDQPWCGKFIFVYHVDISQGSVETYLKFGGIF